MKAPILLAAALLAACGTTGGAGGSSGNYRVTDAEKIGEAIRLTLATEWRGIQCSASVDGLKVGSGLGNSLAGVAKVSIYVPSKYNARPVKDFVIDCARF